MSMKQQKRLSDEISAVIEQHGNGMPVAEVYGVLDVIKFNIHESLTRADPEIKPPQTGTG